jgi:hypothetical protein
MAVFFCGSPNKEAGPVMAVKKPILWAAHPGLTKAVHKTIVKKTIQLFFINLLLS